MADPYDLCWKMHEMSCTTRVCGGLLDAIAEAQTILVETPGVEKVDIYCDGLWRLTIRSGE
jgi:hypothetical protein